MALPSSSSSLPSSSSYIPKKSFNVFISFRGEDTRYGFTSHLHAALREKKIKTYLDEKHLDRGEKITPGLLRGIEESQLAVIVFSVNYASSSFCLDELVHILQCKSVDEKQVIPVFYKVDPSHVRKQLGSYKHAFDKHQLRFKDDLARVQSWRSALVTAASLSGYDSEDPKYKNENTLVSAIVEDIKKKLNSVSTFHIDTQKFVGTEQPVKEIESKLRLDTSDVRVIGLWGIGGIGKTTLASLVYSKLEGKFDGRCFLDNVKEKWEKHKSHHLGKEVFMTLLGEKDTNTSFKFEISHFQKQRLKQTKSLVVLDDVNDREQLEYFVGYLEWLCNGSRIIVTSRDRQCLVGLVDDIHEVKGLDRDKARQLFCMNALKRSSQSHVPFPPELIERVVELAEGIPLILNHLRLHFESKSNKYWEPLLNELKTSPASNKIQKVLMLSYNDLTETQKSVFLDIACFYKGCERQTVMKSVLDDSDFCVDSTIDDLVDKSLVTINYSGQLWMHDLVQEMGQKVEQELKPRTRLCNFRDILKILKNNNNTLPDEVKAISINLSDGSIKEEDLKPDIFRPFYNLRALKIYHGRYSNKFCRLYLRNGLSCLPDELRYLMWEEYPAKSLPSSFNPEKLVELIITHSQVERLWDGAQNLGSLRTINLSYSNNLTEVPDLSHAPNLEVVNFNSCKSLVQVPSIKFQNLKRLVRLKMSGCEKLENLPDSIESVEELDLTYCGNLKNMPDVKKRNVLSLHLVRSGIKELPESVGSFQNLNNLSVSNCERLENLPSSMYQLKLLTKLQLYGCASLEKIPDSLPTTLQEIDMRGTAIKEVPNSIEVLSNLSSLSLDYCEELRSLPITICKLKYLSSLSLEGCSEFNDFPEILEPMEKLTFLDLSKTIITTLPSSIENLVALSNLNLASCEKLDFVPRSIYKLERLRYLNLSGISQNLKWLFQTVERFPKLMELDLQNCNILEVPGNWLSGFELVKKLNINVGNDLHGMPLSIAGFCNLKTLRIWNWKKLRSLSEFSCNLQAFQAIGCTSLESVPSSRDAIMQGYSGRRLSWLDDANYEVIIVFMECLNLSKNAIDNIIADGILRIFVSALLDWHQSTEVMWPGDFGYETLICYPGDEIPEWFSYQEKSSSIAIELSPHWWNTHFLGFSLCLVLSFNQQDYEPFDLSFKLEFEFKTESGESHKSYQHFNAFLYNYDKEKVESIIISNHVLMCYKCFNFAEVFGAAKGSVTEVSIHFYPIRKSEVGPNYYSKVTNNFWDKVKKCDPEVTNKLWATVKQCGIRPLHLRDAEKIGINIPRHYYRKPTLLLDSLSLNTFNFCAHPYWNAIFLHDSKIETQVKRQNNYENVGVMKRYDLTLEKRKLTIGEVKLIYYKIKFSEEMRDMQRKNDSDATATSMGVSSATNIPILYQIQTSFMMRVSSVISEFDDKLLESDYGPQIMPPGPSRPCLSHEGRPSSLTQSAFLTLQPGNVNEDNLQEEAHEEAPQAKRMKTTSEAASSEGINTSKQTTEQQEGEYEVVPNELSDLFNN